MIGQTIPDNVPTPFEMPIKMLAYLGAISRWLTLKPEIHVESLTQRISSLLEVPIKYSLPYSPPSLKELGTQQVLTNYFLLI